MRLWPLVLLLPVAAQAQVPVWFAQNWWWLEWAFGFGMSAVSGLVLWQWDILHGRPNAMTKAYFFGRVGGSLIAGLGAFLAAKEAGWSPYMVGVAQLTAAMYGAEWMMKHLGTWFERRFKRALGLDTGPVPLADRKDDRDTR